MKGKCQGLIGMGEESWFLASKQNNFGELYTLPPGSSLDLTLSDKRFLLSLFPLALTDVFQELSLSTSHAPKSLPQALLLGNLS